MNGASTRTRPSDRKEGISQLAHRPCKSDPKRAWRKQNNEAKERRSEGGEKGREGKSESGNESEREGRGKKE